LDLSNSYDETLTNRAIYKFYLGLLEGAKNDLLKAKQDFLHFKVEWDLEPNECLKRERIEDFLSKIKE